MNLFARFRTLEAENKKLRQDLDNLYEIVRLRLAKEPSDALFPTFKTQAGPEHRRDLESRIKEMKANAKETANAS